MSKTRRRSSSSIQLSSYREQLYRRWQSARSWSRRFADRASDDPVRLEWEFKEREAYQALQAEELRLLQPDALLYPQTPGGVA